VRSSAARARLPRHSGQAFDGAATTTAASRNRSFSRIDYRPDRRAGVAEHPASPDGEERRRGQGASDRRSSSVSRTEDKDDTGPRPLSIQRELKTRAPVAKFAKNLRRTQGARHDAKSPRRALRCPPRAVQQLRARLPTPPSQPLAADGLPRVTSARSAALKPNPPPPPPPPPHPHPKKKKTKKQPHKNHGL